MMCRKEMTKERSGINLDYFKQSIKSSYISYDTIGNNICQRFSTTKFTKGSR